MVASRSTSLAIFVCLLSVQCSLGARKHARKVSGGKVQCHVSERPFSSSNGFGSYGVSYNLAAENCLGCNLFKLTDLSPILEGKLEGEKHCRCWGKAAGDTWNEFFSFKKMPHEKCDWGTCWNLYGKLLTKRDMKFKGTASDDFHSQNHWESKCIETDAPEDNFKGPSVGEVIGVIVNNPKKPAKDPTDDLEPIVVDERMKDDVKELLEDEFLEEDDDLIVVDDTDPVVDPTPVDPEPVVDPTPVNPTPVDPAVCHKTTPPDACACIQKYDKASWKRGQVNDVIKAIGQCVCDLENGPLEPGEPFPLVTKAGRMNCMRRSLQTMRELGGGFACKLQKYEGHGNKQRCHSHYPMADVEGEKARKTFNPK